MGFLHQRLTSFHNRTTLPATLLLGFHAGPPLGT